jgi:hypothetical protein
MRAETKSTQQNIIANMEIEKKGLLDETEGLLKEFARLPFLPASEETAPAGKKTGPAGGETASADEKTAPVREKAAPAGELTINLSFLIGVYLPLGGKRGKINPKKKRR